MDNVPPTPPVVVNTSSKKKPLLILLVILIVTALIAGGSVLVRNYRVAQTPPLAVESKIPADIPVDNRSLTITGQITDFDGKNIVIKKDDGEIGRIQVASKINIFKLVDGRYLSANASNNLGDVQTGKDATLTLVDEDGAYKVGTVSYVVPINVPPAAAVPVSTNSAVNNP